MKLGKRSGPCRVHYAAKLVFFIPTHFVLEARLARSALECGSGACGAAVLADVRPQQIRRDSSASRAGEALRPATSPPRRRGSTAGGVDSRSPASAEDKLRGNDEWWACGRDFNERSWNVYENKGPT